MDDTLARVNVLSYRPGESLNWHFDRSMFTTTLLLQAAEHDGIFEYRRELRTDTDPNHDGVGRVVAGTDPDVIRCAVQPGALNVFFGKNTAHRVTTVEGSPCSRSTTARAWCSATARISGSTAAPHREHGTSRWCPGHRAASTRGRRAAGL
jgi:hypothetical protein